MLIAVVGGAVLLTVAGLAGNRPPLLDEPGPGARLWRYLSSNVAETSPDSPYPELRTRCLPGDPGSLRAQVVAVATDLGWHLEAVEGDSVAFVAVTPLLRFRDDVSVRLKPAACGTQLQVRSSSRVGKGDLGANIRHIMDLHSGLGEFPDP